METLCVASSRGTSANAALANSSCFLKLPADLREGFDRACSREVRCPGNAQMCPEPKSRMLITAGVLATGLVVSSAVPLQFQKQLKYQPCNSQPLSPLTSRASFLHVCDCLRCHHTSWILLFKHIFPSGRWDTWKCQNRRSFPTGHANEHHWNILIPEPLQQVTYHVNYYHVPQQRQMRARPARISQVNRSDLQHTPRAAHGAMICDVRFKDVLACAVIQNIPRRPLRYSLTP